MLYEVMKKRTNFTVGKTYEYDGHFIKDDGSDGCVDCGMLKRGSCRYFKEIKSGKDAFFAEANKRN